MQDQSQQTDQSPSPALTLADCRTVAQLIAALTWYRVNIPDAPKGDPVAQLHTARDAELEAALVESLMYYGPVTHAGRIFHTTIPIRAGRFWYASCCPADRCAWPAV